MSSNKTFRVNKVNKVFWIVLGFLGVGLGAIGAVFPMIPTVPFLMLALVSFGKSSERLHNWFVGSKLYKNNLESFVKGQGMTWATKIKIMTLITLLMGFGFYVMLGKNLYVPCFILVGIWVAHIIYFVFGVKKCVH